MSVGDAKRWVKAIRDARPWRPGHASLLLQGARGARDGARYDDRDCLIAAAAWLEAAQDSAKRRRDCGPVSAGYGLVVFLSGNDGLYDPNSSLPRGGPRPRPVPRASRRGGQVSAVNSATAWWLPRHGDRAQLQRAVGLQFGPDHSWTARMAYCDRRCAGPGSSDPGRRMAGLDTGVRRQLAQIFLQRGGGRLRGASFLLDRGTRCAYIRAPVSRLRLPTPRLGPRPRRSRDGLVSARRFHAGAAPGGRSVHAYDRLYHLGGAVFLGNPRSGRWGRRSIACRAGRRP